MKIKAHRGASFDAPENTLAAIELAWARRADGVEVDVHMSSDGHPVVIHDDTTGRTGGPDKKVGEQTLVQLQAHDVGAWKGGAYRGQRIPTLAAVLDTVPRGRTLFIEIKSDVASVPTIAAVIRTHDPTARGGNYAFESFALPVLAAVKLELPQAVRYWTVGARRDPATDQPLPLDVAIVKQASAAGVAGIAADHRGVTAAFRDAAKQANIALGVWTVDDPSDARRMRALGATWIETNRPAFIRAAL